MAIESLASHGEALAPRIAHRSGPGTGHQFRSADVLAGRHIGRVSEASIAPFVVDRVAHPRNERRPAFLRVGARLRSHPDGEHG
jgi:hypothetical protein